MADEPGTGTLTPTADSPSEPSVNLAPDLAPQPAVQDEPGREEGAAPADGGEPSGGEDDKGDAPDPAAQLTALAEHVKGREEAATKEGHDAALRRMDGHGRQQTAHLRTIAESVPAIAKGIAGLEKRAKEGGDVSVADYDELLTKHGQTLDTFTGYTYRAGAWNGWLGLLAAVDEEVLKTGELHSQFASRIEAVANNDSDPTLVEDIVDAISGAVVKAALEKAQPQWEKQVRDNVASERRNEERNGTAAPAKPTGGGGGTIDNSDSARLDRLSGIGANGVAPTDEDRAWLAVRN